MIRERLKEIDIKITELADYLQITRPTLYKFIENYDNGDLNSINKKVIKLFDYIEGNPLAGRKTVLNYILTNLVEEKELGETVDIAKFNKIKKYLQENPDSDKSKFIEYITSKNEFDSLITYLISIKDLLRKRKLTEEEIRLLKPYDDFINNIEKEEN